MILLCDPGDRGSEHLDGALSIAAIVERIEDSLRDSEQVEADDRGRRTLDPFNQAFAEPGLGRNTRGQDV